MKRKLSEGEKPPLSRRRIAGQILGGAVCGIISGMGAYYLSWSRFITHPIDDMLPAIGIALGSFLGVYLIGNIGNKTGSFLATFGGSILPASGCFAYGYLRGSFRDASIVVVWVFVATAVFFPSICATIGFDLTRRYKNRLHLKQVQTKPDRHLK